MFRLRFNEDYRSRAHFSMLVSDLHLGASADYIIHFIFPMWLLRVAPALGENVDSRAHGRHAQKFQVALGGRATLALEIIEMEEMVHTTDRSKDVDSVITALLNNVPMRP